jgi:uncharacterized Zn finger protein
MRAANIQRFNRGETMNTNKIGCYICGADKLEAVEIMRPFRNVILLRCKKCGCCNEKLIKLI